MKIVRPAYDDSHCPPPMAFLSFAGNFLAMLKPIFFIPLIICSILSCKSKPDTTQPVIQNITESVYASGIIKSKGQYEVFSTVNGLIGEILVKEGDLISRNQPLIRLTNTTARLNAENAKIVADYSSLSANREKLDQLKTSIEQARIKLENDKAMFDRQQKLWDQEIGTRNELDLRELAYKTSLNNFENAKLLYTELTKQVRFQAKQSQKNLDISNSVSGDYIVRSRTDGRVYSILKEEGEMLSIQNPVALIGDENEFVIELQVDEYDIARVKPGQKVLVGMDSYKGQVFEATVTRLGPFMNERSKTFTIEACFSKQPTLLYPNLTCEANIVVQEKDSVLTIPRSWLLDGEYVLSGKKKKIKVKTGLKDYQKVEIQEGLSVRDIIIKPQ
jgi:HlyD family secretion protein